MEGMLYDAINSYLSQYSQISILNLFKIPKYIFAFSADCCPTLELTTTISFQTSRFGTYTMTSPLQTTTHNGVDYPVYEKGSDFLHFFPFFPTPWFIGGTVGVGSSGVRLGPSPQCPNLANVATAFNGSSFVTLDSSQWSINCVKRK